MSLEPDELERAEVLYRDWAARARCAGLGKRLTEVSKAMVAVGNAIPVELKGGQARPVVRLNPGGKFSTAPANTIGTTPVEAHKLLAPPELGDLLDEYREALGEAEVRREAVENLSSQAR